jgi:hypothetical protein
MLSSHNSVGGFPTVTAFFNPRLVPMGFVFIKVALAQFSFEYFSFLCQFIPSEVTFLQGWYNEPFTA